MEIIPYTLAENAGLNPIRIVTGKALLGMLCFVRCLPRLRVLAELRKQHAEGHKYAGINVRKGTISDLKEEGVEQPLLVSISALTLATETVRMILKCDDYVMGR